MSIKAIGFDFGGVIAGPPGSVFEKKMSSLLGVDQELFQRTYFKYNNLWNDKILSLEEVWGKILRDLRMPRRIDEVILIVKNRPPRETSVDMLNLVDALRTRYKVGLLSNNSVTAAEGLRKKRLVDHFDFVVISAEVGVSKPDPKIFEIFTNNLEVEPQELIFIDDTEMSLTTAAVVGYHPILFTDLNSLLKDLKSVGINLSHIH